jgi:hypothetical protein
MNNIEKRDYTKISPSAKIVLQMKENTDIPFANEIASNDFSQLSSYAKFQQIIGAYAAQQMQYTKPIQASWRLKLKE